MKITPKQFHGADGVEDWRVVGDGACAHFRTGSFADGARLVEAIGEAVAEGSHHPDVDLRDEGVTVRLVTSTEDFWGLTDSDVELARTISGLARRLGVSADPSVVQTVQVTVGSHAPAEVIPFWRALLGYDDRGDEDLVDPLGRGAPFWFQELAKPREHRNRIHVDVFVPHDQAEARVAAALAAGGSLLSDRDAPAWWTLADPVGNVADVATWMGRD